MNLLYPQTLVALIVLVIISISASVKPVKSAECNQTCGTAARENPIRVPYPFGFSPGCGIPLNCTATGQIKIGKFQVQNITSDSILINLPAECGRTVPQTKPLFGPNYALTSQNGLLLKNCTSQLNDCIISTAMVEARYGSWDCKFGSDNVGCYSGTDARSAFISYDNLTQSGCGEVYSSIAEVDVGGDDDAGRNSTVSLQFQAAELGWWLDGGCECSAEAECTIVTVPRGGSGYRCQCREGFVGDGFAGGSGCQKGESKSTLDEAKQQYGEIEGPLQAKPMQFCKFKFEHCWKLLKDSPKWNDHVLVRNTSKGCKKPSNPQSQAIDLDDLGTPSTPSTPCSIPLDEFKSMDHEHNQVRPAEGRRKAKAKRKNKWRDEESTLYLKSINETLAQTVIIEKEKLEAKKKSEEEKWESKKRRDEQKTLREEMKVMRQSMVGLTPEQAAYWKLQQSLIVERYKANGFLTDLETYEKNYDFNF
ncbi:hypothetical protein RHMOL_Rhmol12G0165600 [Rhododendron molle]|uniref:Uncharacterized protein n=1 Tax=Rhododendron molle TaxID=49168 RepID=A0ACC0LK35_RHOML|nr:hypothetical protein RHMOL_Rhmol12G0165600 [Rhododendron molle]